jgi:hypothetical protein
MAGRVDMSARSIEDGSHGPSIRLAMEAGSQCWLAGLHDCPPRVSWNVRRVAPGPERAMMESTDSIADPSAERAGIVMSFMLRARPGHPECASSARNRQRGPSGLRRARKRPGQDIDFASRDTGPDFPPYG